MDDFKKKYYEYIDSNKWIMKSNNYKQLHPSCEICGEMNKPYSWVHCHHITYKNFMNETDKDLIILCKSCHLKVHSDNKKIKEKYRKYILSIKSGGIFVKD